MLDCCVMVSKLLILFLYALSLSCSLLLVFGALKSGLIYCVVFPYGQITTAVCIGVSCSKYEE